MALQWEEDQRSAPKEEGERTNWSSGVAAGSAERERTELTVKD